MTDFFVNKGFSPLVTEAVNLVSVLKYVMIATLLFGGTTSNVLTMIALALVFFAGLWLVVGFVRWLQKSPWKGNRTMRRTLEEFRTLIERSLPELAHVEDAEAKPAPDKWSKKEILGHLIDSAANNHQRFVRAQLSAELKLPGYNQVVWVKTQRYDNESWEDLVQLWKSYNLHLLHIASGIPDTSLKNYCFIGDNEPVTLGFLVQDYVRHLKHHLGQILEISA